MKNKSDPYLGYFPLRLWEELPTKATLKFMMFLFYKCKLTSNTVDVLIRVEDIRGISRGNFYIALETLKENNYFTYSKRDTHTYKITLSENYYSKEEIMMLRSVYSKGDL